MQRESHQDRAEREQDAAARDARSAEAAEQPVDAGRHEIASRTRVGAGERGGADQGRQQDRRGEVRRALRAIQRAHEAKSERGAGERSGAEGEERRAARAALRGEESASGCARREREDLELAQPALEIQHEAQSAGEREQASDARAEQHARSIDTQ